MTLGQAIAHAKEVAASKCDECGKEHAELAEWLTQLYAYEETTPISEPFLQRLGFVKKYREERLNVSSGDYWIDRLKHVQIVPLGSMYENTYLICHANVTAHVDTIGELCMFLALCKENELVKLIKANIL